MSELSFFLCPTSLALMEVGPREKITLEVGAIYAEVILLNGVLYGAIAFIVLGAVEFLKKNGKRRETRVS